MSGGGRKRKKEKYIHRWLREHPQVRLYLTREEYEWLKSIADEKKTSMKNILLEALRNVKLTDEEYRQAYWKGGYDILDAFIDNPEFFYDLLMIRAEKRGLTGFEPALFTIPCSICGEPMVITHKNEKWASELKPILLEAFKGWIHEECEK